MQTAPTMRRSFSEACPRNLRIKPPCTIAEVMPTANNRMPVSLDASFWPTSVPS